MDAEGIDWSLLVWETIGGQEEEELLVLAAAHYTAVVVSDLEALMTLKVEQEMHWWVFWAGSMFAIYVQLVWKASIWGANEMYKL